MEPIQTSLKAALKKAVLLAGALAIGGAVAFAQSAPPPSDAVAPSGSEIADLRAQLSQMQTMIAQLEAKVQTLSAQEDVKTAAMQAQQSAAQAQDSALKASEIYSATLASMEESAALRAGNTTSFPEGIEFKDLTKGFEFHGYMRSGFGVNGKGGAQEIFQIPIVYDAFGARYRLGNEDDTYGRLSFVNNFLYPDLKQDGVKFKTEATIGFSAYNGVNNSPTAAPTASRGNKLTVEEAYAEASGVWTSKPDVSFWAGQREWFTPSIHINKLQLCYYNGYGGGFDGLRFWDEKFGTFGAAWLGGSIDNLNPDGTIATESVTINGTTFAAQNLAKNSLVFKQEGIEVPFGKATVWLTLANSKGGTINGFDTTTKAPKTLTFQSARGFAVGFIHTAAPFFGGYNQFSIQYGKGAASNFQAEVRKPYLEVSSSSLFGITEYFVIQPMKELSIGATALFVHANTGNAGPTVGNLSGGKINWYSVGVRPVWHFTRFFSVAFEGSVDYVKHYDNTLGFLDGKPLTVKGALYKLTIAPQITPNWDFYVRPSIRLFATYAWWSNGLKGQVGQPAYSTATQGISAGMQFEAWW